MGEIPPMRKLRSQERKESGDETKGCDAVTDKVKSAMRGLEPLLFPSSAEPTIDHYMQIDWSLAYDSLPIKAQELLALVVESCHPSTLQQILAIARQRIMNDFQLWAMQRDVEEMLQIGDKIYRKRRKDADLIL